MLPERLRAALKFCYVIDGIHPDFTARDQIQTALAAGATLIRYPAHLFSPADFRELEGIRNLCRSNAVPFLIDNDPILAKAIDANGIHLDGELANPVEWQPILGADAICGISIVSFRQLDNIPWGPLDYVAITPNMAVKEIEKARIPTPVVVSIDRLGTHLDRRIISGATGISVHGQSLGHPASARTKLSAIAAASNCPARDVLAQPWQDEFGLIARLIDRRSPDQDHPAIRVPAGDDACLLRALENPVITTDTQREGVHFRFDWQTPEEIGHKAVSVTLSDLAASYAKPMSLFINLCLPPGISDATIEAVYGGIRKALSHYGCTLGGGNTSRGRLFALDLFAVGDGRKEVFPTRGAARPGDGLYTTGPLGLARAGLAALQAKDTSFSSLINRFKMPLARFDAAAILAHQGVRCVMDISDGLAGDARHIARASGLSIEIDLEAMKLEKDLKDLAAFCRKYNRNATVMMLSGGEDYELLFTCKPETFKRIKTMLPSAVPVGRCVDFDGQLLLGEAADVFSFQHGSV